MVMIRGSKRQERRKAERNRLMAVACGVLAVVVMWLGVCGKESKLSSAEAAERARIAARSEARQGASPAVKRGDLRSRRRGRSVKEFTGKCVWVIDGDTMEVMPDGTRERVRVRIWGIDAPEKNQAGGDAATVSLQGLAEGQQVRVVKRGSSYGRIVGQVRVGGKSAALWQLLHGHAWHYEKYAPYAKGLRKAQEKARRAKRGIWARPGAVAPWDYRKGRR